MASLQDIVTYLDELLQTRSLADYPGALNGLQLANSGKIERVISAVDASLRVIEEVAAVGKSSLLIVHHGMFWQGAQPVTGAFYRKLKAAMEADLAIYSSHLPLDVHPDFGNNVMLARAIGLQDSRPFFDQKGLQLGLRGTWTGTLDELVEVTGKAVAGPVHLCPGGPQKLLEVGIITGGAGSEVAKVSASGVNTFITGEGPHWSYPLAEELGINLLYAGHYATETFGVRAISAEIAKKWGISSSFHDHPTGL